MLDNTQRLARTPLGQQLGAADCAELAQLMSVSQLAAGDVLFHRGDPGDALYIVLLGQLKVALHNAEHSESDKELVVALLGPGGVVGELEVVTDIERMATAVATKPTTLLRLDATVLRKRPQDHAAVLSRLVDTIARVLGMRLAAVNAKLLAAWEAESTAGNAEQDVRQLLDDVWQW